MSELLHVISFDNWVHRSKILWAMSWRLSMPNKTYIIYEAVGLTQVLSVCLSFDHLSHTHSGLHADERVHLFILRRSPTRRDLFNDAYWSSRFATPVPVGKYKLFEFLWVTPNENS